MTDAEKVKVLAITLRAINKQIYAKGAPLGSENYFVIRCGIMDALRATGEPIE